MALPILVLFNILALYISLTVAKADHAVFYHYFKFIEDKNKCEFKIRTTTILSNDSDRCESKKKYWPTFISPLFMPKLL